MKSPRKAWQTPQVFVLGAEGTQAYKVAGTNEDLIHLASQVVHLPVSTTLTIKGSDNFAQGYES
jgi:hypothetical protein